MPNCLSCGSETVPDANFRPPDLRPFGLKARIVEIAGGVN